jgi:hypothetical protein
MRAIYGWSVWTRAQPVKVLLIVREFTGLASHGIEDGDSKEKKRMCKRPSSKQKKREKRN